MFEKQLLVEGPVGHMAHPYENLSLTFGKLKEMFKVVFDGFPDIEVTEKLDGQNIIVTYDHESDRALAIRRMAEHSEMGGIDKEAVLKFFTTDKIEKAHQVLIKKGKSEEEAKKLAQGASIEHVANAFHDAMANFEKVARNMPREFFVDEEGCKIFYNGEVVDPRSRNIVDYDTQDLVIHRTLHSKLCPEESRLQSMDSEEAQVYSKFLEKYLQMSQSEDEISGVKVNALRNFDNLVVDEELLSRAYSEVDNLMAASGLNEDSRIQDYLKKVLDETIENKIPNVNRKIADLISEAVFYFVRNKTIPRLRNEINPILELVGNENTREVIKEFLRNRAALAELIREAVMPIEYIVHNFGAGYLKAVKSLYILNHDQVTGDLKKKVGHHVTRVHSGNAKADLAVLQRNIAKMLSHNKELDPEDVLTDTAIVQIYDKIETAVEGLVFTFDGQEYKITGQFAPINQIMGLGRFSRGDGKRDDINELPSPGTYEGLVRESIEAGQNIAVFSGGFKPPHVGHYLASKYLAKRAEADKLYILVGSTVRTSKNKSVTIGPEEAAMLWNKYYDDAPEVNYDVEIVKISGSPIRWAYEMVESGNFDTDQIFVGIGQCVSDPEGCSEEEMTPEDERWAQIPARYENAHQIIIPLQGGAVRGSTMRELLANEDDRFMRYLPDHLSDNDKLEIRNNLLDKDYLKY
jgi:nicotinamide mononucleotide adenylyltransferase